MDISVIIPCYNEEANVELLYERCAQVLRPLNRSFELIFVNDGSKDQTLGKIRGLANRYDEVRYITLSRNFGHQIAVSAGLDYADGEAVVIIDADLQDPPEMMVRLWEKMKEGYDVVYARRNRRAGETWLKLFTARMFYRILSKITSVSIPVDTGDFRVISRKVVLALRHMPERQKFLRGQISWVGFRQTFLTYDRLERAGGKTGYTYAKMIRFALDGITSFSDFPLKLASITGFVVSGVAFLVMIISIYQRLFTKNYVDGWASLITAILFLGGIQLISIGVIGEYISRISTNVRKRPLYIVDDSNIEGVETLPPYNH